jgi:PhnB protein
MSETTKSTPPGYHTIQPYLHFQNTREAIDFYKTVFGASERLCMKRDDGTIAHAEIQLDDSCIMLSDESPQMEAFSPPHYGGSPVSLMIYVQDCDAVYHQALATGAASVREPADQPYGDRMAGIKDPFGYKWWIATHLKDMTREELEQLG